MSHRTRLSRQLLVIVTAALGAAGCGESATAPDLGTANLIGVVYEAQPLDMNPSVIWVRVVARSDPPITPPDTVGVRIWDDTEVFFWRAADDIQPASFSDIEVDDTVRVWHEPDVLLSDPPQVNGTRVEIL